MTVFGIFELSRCLKTRRGMVKSRCWWGKGKTMTGAVGEVGFFLYVGASAGDGAGGGAVVLWCRCWCWGGETNEKKNTNRKAQHHNL